MSFYNYDLFGRSFPEKFVCPLSQEPFKDPVMADDGQTYERAVIEEWFKTEGPKSPITNEVTRAH
jgi:hypothetical protein